MNVAGFLHPGLSDSDLRIAAKKVKMCRQALDMGSTHLRRFYSVPYGTWCVPFWPPATHISSLTGLFFETWLNKTSYRDTRNSNFLNPKKELKTWVVFVDGNSLLPNARWFMPGFTGCFCRVQAFYYRHKPPFRKSQITQDRILSDRILYKSQDAWYIWFHCLVVTTVHNISRIRIRWLH